MKNTLVTLALLALAGAAQAQCTVSDDELHSLIGEPLSDVQAHLSGPMHQCTLTLNGTVSGAFGDWLKPAAPADKKWGDSTILVTVESGRVLPIGDHIQGEWVWQMFRHRCPAGEDECTLPPGARIFPTPAKPKAPKAKGATDLSKLRPQFLEPEVKRSNFH